MTTARSIIASYKERLHYEISARETLVRTLNIIHLPELRCRGEQLLVAAEAKILELQLCTSKLEAIA